MTSVIDENTQYVDTAGAPIVGGLLYIGVDGLDPKVNPTSIFSDRALTAALANPQTLDSLGRSTNKIWIGGKYSLRASTSLDVQVYQELDNGTDLSTADIFKLVSVTGSNTITASSGQSLSAYTGNQQFTFETVAVNTGPVTLNVDAVGAVAIVKNNDQPLVAGELEANQTVLVVYNATNANFELVNPNAKVVAFSEGTPVVAAATTNIWATDGNTIHITGTTGITSFGTAPAIGARRTVIFDDVVTITHGVNLELPGNANFTTAAGDILHVYADTTTQFDVEITKKDGSAVTAAAVLSLGSVAGTNTITGSTAITLTAYVGNQQFVLETAGANTGPVTLNVNSIGAKAVVKNKDQAILDGEFEINQTVIVAYNATNDNFEWVNQNNKRLDTYEGSDVASTATTNIWAKDGNTVHVTGVSTITSLGTALNVGATQRVVFDGILLLTHSANLKLPGEIDYTTSAGDVAYVYADTTSQFDVDLVPQSGTPIIGETIINLSGVAGTDTITATASPTITAYKDKQLYIFTPVVTNTGAITLNIDSVGAKDVEKNNGRAIINGEFVVNRSVIVMYLAALDQFTAVSWDDRVLGMYTANTFPATTTTDIWSTEGNIVTLSGTATVTSFGTSPENGAFRLLRFADAVTIQANSTIRLPGTVDYTAGVRDIALVLAVSSTISEITVWKQDGTPVITASAAETVTTTSPSAVKPMTPANFGGNKSMAADGYYKFPGGLVVQWGDITNAGASGAVVFPLTFTTLFTITQSVNLAQDHWITVPTTSGFTTNNGGTNVTHNWQAIGLINV